MARTIRLRPWQKEALERFRVRVGSGRASDFLAVATPGAGKTTFALTAACHWLSDVEVAHHDARLVVVAPTQHLKRQWAQAATHFGLALEPFWRAGDALPSDMDGVVTTYQQVASSPRALAAVAHHGFVVLDEVHHAGDERAWGDGLRVAFSGADARLSLSGTPFRSDTNPIPFVTYEWEEAVPDFEYGYADALHDGGVVRPVHFPRIKGHMEWVGADGQFHSHDFDDDLDRARANQRLRTALSADGQWMSSVLEDAHRRLVDVRRTQPDAGGLVICMDLEHARAIAELIERRWRIRPTVATSDDPMASARIGRFAAGRDPWIVAVRMVSEGVDIPRLRVGVFATNTTTELFFRQALGRLVRWTSGLRTQRAWMYVPDDPRIRRLAEGIAEQRRHSLVTRRAEDGEDADEPVEDAALADETEDEEQLSLFQAMSAVATGVEGADAPDDAGSPEELVWEPDHSDASLEIPLPPRRRRRPSGAVTADGSVRSVAETKTKLRKDNAALVAHLVAVTGRSHREVNGELNRRSGVRKVTEATAHQLVERLAAGERWVKQL